MYLRHTFRLQAPHEQAGEGAAGIVDGNDIIAPNLDYASDQELINDGYEIENGDGVALGLPDDGQPVTEPEELEHRGEMTQQEMLDELAKDNEEEGNEGKEEAAEEFKIPEDFKDVLKRGDELHQVGYEEIKELAQKGYDYTQKTQEVANERKELEDTFGVKESELTKAYEVFQEDVGKHQQQLDDYNKFDYALQMMKEKDPDLFESIAEYANEAQRVLDNPVNRGLKSQISKLEETIQSIQEQSQNSNQREKNDLILKGFNTDLDAVQSSYADTFKKIGLAPDWEKVKEAWIGGEKNNTTVESALFEVYGPQITKLYQSKMAVKQTAAKVGKRSAVSPQARMPRATKLNNTDWGPYTEDLFNQLQAGTLEI